MSVHIDPLTAVIFFLIGFAVGAAFAAVKVAVAQARRPAIS